MRIKDQIRIARERKGWTLKQLADSVGVTEQAVRHWEDGRSNPGKSKAPAVEEALGIVIDWTEGRAAVRAGGGTTAAAMVDQSDMELFFAIARLPLESKQCITELVRLHAAALDAARMTPAERATLAPVESFEDRAGNESAAEKVKPIRRSAPRRRTG